MEKWTVRIGLLAVIILLALNLIMPINSAKSAQQYHYLIVTYNPVKLQQLLNQTAEAGWEFVAITSGRDDFIILRK